MGTHNLSDSIMALHCATQSVAVLSSVLRVHVISFIQTKGSRGEHGAAVAVCVGQGHS